MSHRSDHWSVDVENRARRRVSQNTAIDGASQAADVAAEGALPMTVADVLASVDRRLALRQHDAFRAIPTGFTPFDEVVSGGLHLGDLLLLAGGQGTGKTTFALQMARNVAVAADAACVYLCFEHDELQLLVRLLAMESAQPEARRDGGLTLREVEHLFVAAGRHGIDSVASVAASDRRLAEALERLETYQDRLFLLQPSGRTMTVTAIGELTDLMRQKTGSRVVLFVDYLQKVPAERDFAGENDRVAWVTEGLKDLALRQQVPIVAIAALDIEGLRAQRLQVQHLWGGSALAYEADAILMLTEKADVVARVNFEFNPQKIQTFREWVVASLVKNRRGRNLVDLEYRKRFANGCFDPNGGLVHEKLVDERLYRE